MVEITELRIYPVKSLHGIALDEARLGVRGLDWDRNWMVTTDSYHFLTQRQIPEMATITVSIKDDALVLAARDRQNLTIPLGNESQAVIQAKVWSDTCEGHDEGDEAASFLTEALGEWRGEKLRLVRFSDSFKRKVEPDFLNGEDAHTAFSDGYPFLVVSEESLALLNSKLSEAGAAPIPMDRFRPNIVLRGLSPLEENSVASLIHENYRIDLRKPCQRCKTTTVNQESGEIKEPKEPLRTLTVMKTIPDQKGAFFGQNSILISGESELIRVGDRVKLEPR